MAAARSGVMNASEKIIAAGPAEVNCGTDARAAGATMITPSRRE